ncbi:MAG: hypothetical protein RIQ89_2265 [Bacteroidota bacterium]|jgi:putative N6-adenine-specific DNA methylase
MELLSNIYIAKTQFGIEPLLVAELMALGAGEVTGLTRAVSFTGDASVMMRVNYQSRFAIRVLKPIFRFKAMNEKELYEGVQQVAWKDYMKEGDTLAVDAVSHQSAMSHTQFIAQLTKDAIVDQFRKATGNRPNVDLFIPKIRVNIHLQGDTATVALDSSGVSLHKRGYRNMQGEAPLNEVLAAAIIKMSGWERDMPLVDWMCGSGTILIEAAMQGLNIAPGKFIEEFGFERWDDFDSGVLNKIKDDARNAEEYDRKLNLIGVDKNGMVLNAARENASAAGVAKYINFEKGDFSTFIPAQLPMMVVSNPPYGGRITTDDLLQLYKSMGDALKKNFAGSSAWLLTANQDAAKSIGLKASKKIPLYNGPLECRLLKYDLFKGDHKSYKTQLNNSKNV